MTGLHLERVSYTASLRQWVDRVGQHYLDNAPPGCLLAVGVWAAAPGLLPGCTQPCGPIRGLCVVGRPVARQLPQDGSWGEVTRMVLLPGLPHGTASEVLRFAAAAARARGMVALIAYHDRTRHTGCIYRKAGFRKDGTTQPREGAAGWSSRPGREQSAAAGQTPKRRWRLDL